jgi:hypothetical protein
MYMFMYSTISIAQLSAIYMHSQGPLCLYMKTKLLVVSIMDFPDTNSSEVEPGPGKDDAIV